MFLVRAHHFIIPIYYLYGNNGANYNRIFITMHDRTNINVIKLVLMTMTFIDRI